MNPNLLSMVEYPAKQQPMMLDSVPVSDNPDAGPFLVTSSKSLLWVDKAFPGGFLRVAVRKMGAHDLFGSIVKEVAQRGAALEWGNVLPPTTEGAKAALDYLLFYELPGVTLLYGSDFDIGLSPFEEVPRVPVDWLPSDWAVLVPDREFVGTTFLFKGGHVGALVHNPSRGVVILKPA